MVETTKPTTAELRASWPGQYNTLMNPHEVPTALTKERIERLNADIDRLQGELAQSRLICREYVRASAVSHTERDALQGENGRARELFGRITRSPREKGSAQRVLHQIIEDAKSFVGQGREV